MKLKKHTAISLRVTEALLTQAIIALMAWNWEISLAWTVAMLMTATTALALLWGDDQRRERRRAEADRDYYRQCYFDALDELEPENLGPRRLMARNAL